MASTTVLHNLDKVELSSFPQAPQKALPRIYPAVPQDDRSLSNTPAPFSPTSPYGEQETKAQGERDLEMSEPGTPPSGEPSILAIEAIPSLTDPPMNKYRFAAVCVQTLLAGLTDSAPGALIPYMEK